MTKLGRPLPLEYLIIELTTSTPLNPQPLLVGGKDPPFPVENRATIGQSMEGFAVLSTYLSNQQSTNFLCAISDFHLLLYLYTNELAGLDLKVHPSRVHCSAVTESLIPSLCSPTSLSSVRPSVNRTVHWLSSGAIASPGPL